MYVHGRLAVHDDPVWVGGLVRRLTDQYEAGRAQPWRVDDEPPSYVAGQLRGIVGVELVISRIEASAKLSQNRSEEDVARVVAALRERGEHAAAAAVEAAR